MTSKQIRKELALLIVEKQKNCTTEKQKNKAVNESRQEINEKYGKSWREKDDTIHKKQSYDEWWHEKNMDGYFAYNGVTDDF
jgi:hypothetical protein